MTFKTGQPNHILYRKRGLWRGEDWGFKRSRHESNKNVHWWMNKEDVVHIALEYYSAIRKNEITPFPTTGMDLEIIMVQLSPSMRHGKTTALTIWIFVCDDVSAFNMLLGLCSSPSKDSVFEFHGCGHHLQWFKEPKNIKPISASFSPLLPWSLFCWRDWNREYMEVRS